MVVVTPMPSDKNPPLGLGAAGRLAEQQPRPGASAAGRKEGGETAKDEKNCGIESSSTQPSSAVDQAVDGTDELTSASCSAIAREFVRQYFTLLNEKHEICHRFYGENSKLARGGLTHAGPAGIKNFFSSLDLHNSYVKVLLVDSNYIDDRGVFMQVFGEISNNKEFSRRFAQVFILALKKGQKKYYVLLDTLTYFDEIPQYTNTAAAILPCSLQASDNLSHTHAKVISNKLSNDVVSNGISESQENTGQVAGEIAASIPTAMEATSTSFMPSVEAVADEPPARHGQPYPSRDQLAAESGAQVQDNVENNLAENHYGKTSEISEQFDASATVGLPDVVVVSTSAGVAQLPTPGGVSYALVAGGNLGVKPSSSAMMTPFVHANAPPFSVVLPPTTTLAMGAGGTLMPTMPTQEQFIYDGSGAVIPVIHAESLMNGNPSQPARAPYPAGSHAHGQHLAPPGNVPADKQQLPPFVPSERQIYVRGFRRHNACDYLRAFFSRYGEVSDVTAKFLPEYDFAFVTFESAETVRKVLNGYNSILITDGSQKLKVEKKRENNYGGFIHSYAVNKNLQFQRHHNNNSRNCSAPPPFGQAVAAAPAFRPQMTAPYNNSNYQAYCNVGGFMQALPHYPPHGGGGQSNMHR